SGTTGSRRSATASPCRWSTSRHPARPAAPRPRRHAGGTPAGACDRTPRPGATLARGGFPPNTMDRSPAVLAAQRARGIGAIRALPFGRRDRRVDRTAQFRRCPAGGQAGGVERRGLRLTVQAADEGGHRETLCCCDLASNFRREQRAIAGLRLLACIRSSVADRVQRGARVNPDQRVDYVHVHPGIAILPLPAVTRRTARPPCRSAPSPAPAPPRRRPVRSTAESMDAVDRSNATERSGRWRERACCRLATRQSRRPGCRYG